MSVNFTNIDEFFALDTFEKYEKLEIEAEQHHDMKQTQISMPVSAVPNMVLQATRPITKRKYDSSSKWSHREEKKYLKFVLRELVERPHVTLSWKIWKPEGVFPRMAKYIGTKNPRQCKSYDERKKQSSYIQQKIDMIEFVQREVKKYQKNDTEIADLLSMLKIKKTQQSNHMSFLKNDNQNLKMINSRMDDLLNQINQEL